MKPERFLPPFPGVTAVIYFRRGNAEVGSPRNASTAPSRVEGGREMMVGWWGCDG